MTKKTNRQRELLELLADGSFKSGQALGDSLDLSRAAIWKLVERCRANFDVAIDAVPGKGYRLKQPIEFLDSNRILPALSESSRAALADLAVHDQLASTNTWLMQRAGSSKPSGSACLAERQTAGRGRRGRTWISPFGRNIYLSLLWRFNFSPIELGGLSLAAGVGVALALVEMGVDGVGLKWPNDLFWDRRKLGGLLIEVAGETQGPTAVVCGVGLNTDLTSDDGRSIDQPWSHLREIFGERAVSRNDVAAVVLSRLIWVMREYEQRQLEPFLPLWRRFDLYVGQPIEVRVGHDVLRGIHSGIDDSGSLLLAHDGGIASFRAGEVTLRGVG